MLVTAGGSICISGGGGSFAPAFSADGQHLVFLSYANNLVTNDDRSPWMDIFVHDLPREATVLVSVNSSGIGGLDADALYPSISSGGQYVAYYTCATNLAFSGTNALGNVFLRDLANEVTVPISVNASGTFDEQTTGSRPLISADGRWVLFESRSFDLTTNLPLTQPARASFIYRRDLQNNCTILASQSTNYSGVINSNCFVPSMSLDGRWVTFVGYEIIPRTNPNSRREVHVRDLHLNTTICVNSRVTNEWPVFSDITLEGMNPKISSDGRFVVFNTRYRNSPAGDLWRYDISSNSLVQIVTNVPVDNSTLPSQLAFISSNGNVVLFGNGTNLFCWDVATGSNTLVDVNWNGTGPGNGSTRNASLASDGLRVIFVSDSTDLVATTNQAPGKFQIFVRDWQEGVTHLISTNAAGEMNEDYGAVYPVLSPDGTLAAFDSTDDTLVPGDCNHDSDVFVKNLATGELRLISKRADSLRSATEPGVKFSLSCSLSADGRYLAFAATDGKLVSKDTNGYWDIFVRDLLTGSNLLASIATDGLTQANYNCQDPMIGTDGRYVLFASPSANLFSGQGPMIQTNTNYLYLRDLQLGVTTFIAEHDASSTAALSPSSRYVAFASRATNLVDYLTMTNTSNYANLYLHDLQSHTNILITVDLVSRNGGQGNSRNPKFSNDEKWLAFESSAANIGTNSAVSGAVFLYSLNMPTMNIERLASSSGANESFGPAFSANSGFMIYQSLDASRCARTRDLTAGTSRLVAPYSGNPSISSSGTLVAYQPDYQWQWQFILKNMETQQTENIGINIYQQRSFRKPCHFSYDDRYLIFEGYANVPLWYDKNGYYDIMARDLIHSNTFIISMSCLGNGSAHGLSHLVTLGADGRTVIFHSFADDIVPNDFNGNGDLFLMRLGTDSDGDGLDDEWEIAYFGNLERNGLGDFDGDGLSDVAEYKAGTNPTNGQSCLTVFTLFSLSSTSRRLLWNGGPGTNYRVQYKDSLNQTNWSDLAGEIALTNSTASLTDTNAVGSQRFYRVVVE